jgi:DNA-binding NarL/FixJ family response regulator
VPADLFGARPIRVVIADDERLFADALCLYLQREPQIEVVATAADGDEAVDAALLNDADIVVMDLGMPPVDGLEPTRRLLTLRPSAHVIVLTGRTSDEAEGEALLAGAAGFLTKGGDVEADALIAAILRLAPARHH